MAKKFTFEEIFLAQRQGTNLAEDLDKSILDKIASAVLNRETSDGKTLKDFRETMKKGRQFVKHNESNPVYVAAEDDAALDYNIHLPEMKKLITFKASLLLKSLHSNPYPMTVRVIDQDRKHRIEKYVRYVLYDSPHATWLDSMDRTYPSLLAEGMCIRKVEYNPYCHSTESWAIDNDCITINSQAKSLERAPSIIWRYSCSFSDIMRRIKKKELLAEPYKTRIDAMQDEAYIPDSPHKDNQMMGDEHEMLLAVMWFDLDADGINEPYIVEVDGTLEKTVSLSPNMASSSKVVDMEPIDLYQDIDFVSYRYWQDVEGQFYGYGVYNLFMPLEDCVSRIINNAMNVAHLATNQGAITMGARGLEGIRSFKTGEIKNIPNALAEDINKIIKFPDIKEPSPVMLTLLDRLLAYTDAMGNQNDLSQGNMPNRELPSRTASLLLEKSDEMNQATYRRIFRSVSKELQILCKQIEHEAKFSEYKEQLNKEYQGIVGDPNANMAADFDMETLKDISINADPVLNNTSLQLYRLNDAFTMLSQTQRLSPGNFDKLYLDTLGLADYPNIMLTDQEVQQQAQNQPPPIPQQEIDFKKQQHGDKMAVEKHKLANDDVKTIGDAAKKLSDASQSSRETAIHLLAAVEKAANKPQGGQNGQQ